VTVSRQRIADFASGLRALRRRAGSPSYEVLARETGYPGSTLAAADAGERLPQLTVTLAYVSACRGDTDAWADRWRAASARLSTAEHASLLAPGAPGIATEPVVLPRIRRLSRRGRVIVVLAGVLVLPLVWTIVMPWPSSVRPGLPVTPPTSRQTAPGPPPEFMATAGPGCRRDFVRQVHMSAAPGWNEGRAGSFAGDGCDDRFLYSEGSENYFQWRFGLSEPATRRCAFEVFIPDSPFASAWVRYDVADSFEDADHRIGQFQIDQRANRGTWVVAPAVVLTTADVLVQIGSPAVAGPLRVSCSRSGS
jgi:hypothetical protein